MTISILRETARQTKANNPLISLIAKAGSGNAAPPI